MHLATDIGKAGAEFNEELGNMPVDGGFNGALFRILAQPKEVQPVRVFQRFTRQIGMWTRQLSREISAGHAGTFAQAGFNLDHQNIARPVMFNSLGGIPAALLLLAQFI